MFKFLSKLGPGLLYAGTAVGVSHLIQSTRAGANYGILMIAFVLVANILKYPFFKAGPLYASITGKSLLYGINKLGKLPMALFYFFTISSMFIVSAVVTLICASVASYIFNWQAPLWLISGLIMLLLSLIHISEPTRPY